MIQYFEFKTQIYNSYICIFVIPAEAEIQFGCSCTDEVLVSTQNH